MPRSYCFVLKILYRNFILSVPIISSNLDHVNGSFLINLIPKKCSMHSKKKHLCPADNVISLLRLLLCIGMVFLKTLDLIRYSFSVLLFSRFPLLQIITIVG